MLLSSIVYCPSSAKDLSMTEVAEAFIAQARSLLSQDYLPKIEHCLEKLSDEDVWWRANPESNSIGNLLLHLAGNARQWIVSGVGGGPGGAAWRETWAGRSRE